MADRPHNSHGTQSEPAGVQASSRTSLSPEQAALLLDSIGVGVLLADANGVIVYRNTLAGTWFSDGNTIDECLGEANVVGDFPGWREELGKIVRTGRPGRLEIVARPSPGSTTLLTLLITPVASRESSRCDAAAVVMMESDRSAAVDERLEMASRLASLGKLATRVVHELNNPLDGILRYINLSLRLLENSPQPELKAYLSESRTGLMRMVQIISDLLEYSRATDPAIDTSDINEVVEQAIKSTVADRAENIVVSADFQTEKMPLVTGSRLYQVCCNLIKNAMDAMPHGGQLLITTGLIEEEVVIRVADSGVGLPDPPERAFEPFFTTKQRGKGTGLGLAICKDYIEEMNGSITATPAETGGAVFTVCIPVLSCHSSRKGETSSDPSSERKATRKSSGVTSRSRA